MFYFLRKTIRHGTGHSITHSPTHHLNCLQNYKSILSAKHISTTSNQHSFTVSYLINSCGFSEESALSVSKHVQFESPERPNSVIALLKNHGFLKPQISGLVRRQPQLLLARADKTLLPKLRFFYSKGFSSTQLVHILSTYPRILVRSLENCLIPNFNYLSDFIQSSEKTTTVIKRAPHILETDITLNVGILLDNGVPESNIRFLLCIWPHVLTLKPSDLRNIVEVVTEMGINPLRSQFVVAIAVKKVIHKSLWEKKLNVYKMWGWSEDECLAVFRKFPTCMLTAESKIMSVMDFFVKEMGWESKVIARCPPLINMSLEKRIIPRAAVIQFLSSKGLIDRKYTKMVSLFMYSEKTFLQRFVNCYNEAPQLLKLYKEKLDLSNMTKSSV